MRKRFVTAIASIALAVGALGAVTDAAYAVNGLHPQAAGHHHSRAVNGV